jgi:hypothetical protein
MKTLMRNGRDRRSENPFWATAKKERVVLFGTDQRITSGPAAKRLHSKAGYMAAPERFAESQIPLAPRAPAGADQRHGRREAAETCPPRWTGRYPTLGARCTLDTVQAAAAASLRPTPPRKPFVDVGIDTPHVASILSELLRLVHPDCAAEFGDLQRCAERGIWGGTSFLRSSRCNVIRMIGA